MVPCPRSVIPIDACPACRGRLRRAFDVPTDAGAMAVSVCGSCGSYVKDPWLDAAELRELYARYDHHEKHFDPGPGEIDNLVAKLRRLERRRPGRGRLLEIGCGRGFLLDQALRRGWDAWGAEVEGSAAGHLLPGLEGRVRTVRGDGDFAELEPEAYDVVCSYQVFEHLPRPAEALRSWVRALRPGGLLLVDTPNAGGLGARRHRERWTHHGRRDHFVLFTPRALEGLFRQNGLRVLQRTSGGAPACCCGSAAAGTAARRVFRFRGLTRLLRGMVQRLGLGDNLELLGRKDAR